MSLPKYLRFKDLQERNIISNWMTLKRRVENDGFPPGDYLGRNTRAWREDEVMAWCESRRTNKGACDEAA